MKIRLLGAQELDQVKGLWDYCFEKQDTPFFSWYFDKYCSMENVLGALVDDSLAAMLHLNPYNIELHGQKISTSYIVGVATAPEFRRKGIFHKLLAASFAEMRARGQSLAILMPSAAGVYLQYGFAFCYSQLRYKMPLAELGSVFAKAGKADFLFVGEEEHLPFRQPYAALTADSNGFAVRGSREWESLLSAHKAEGGYAVVLLRDKQYCGYMLYLIRDSLFHVVELAAIDEQGKASLLSYASQHFSQCEDFLWQAPINDLTFLRFANNRYYPSVQPFMMGRIIDPIAAIAELKLAMPDRESISFEIFDSIIKDNNAVFKLSGQNGVAVLEKADCLPDVCLDIGVFAQLCFAAYSVDDLFKAGYLTVNKQGVLPLLARVFSVKTNYINEYF